MKEVINRALPKKVENILAKYRRYSGYKKHEEIKKSGNAGI